MRDAWRHLKPRDAAEVEQAIHWALAGGKALEIVGRGSKRAIGRPAQWDATLDLSGLVRRHALRAGGAGALGQGRHAARRDRGAASRRSGQELAFEPMDYGPLLGAAPAGGTIGGALAANLSGPRRIKAGAARDHFLGVNAVSGRGETFKSGGRVVKNVTGYDLCKLLAGSWGTLAAMTDVTVKTLPRAETEETVLVLGLDDASGGEADDGGHGLVRRRLGGRASAGSGRRAHRRSSPPRAAPSTAFRLEGVAPSVAHRKARAGEARSRLSARSARWSEAPSRALWRAIRDVAPFAAAGPAGARYVWRISTAPSRGAEVGRALVERARGRDPVRLGRRADLGGIAARGRCRRGLGARRPSRRRRPRDADPRAGRACAPRSTCSSRSRRRLRH